MARRTLWKPKAFAARALCIAGFYWWLAAKTEIQQLVVAGIVGLVMGAAVTALASGVGLLFEFKWSWLGLLLVRLPGRIARDLGLLVLALWKALKARTGVSGSYHRLDFKPGGTDPASAARRALVMGGVSLPPNSFAIEVEGKKALLIHQLIFARGQGSPDWPI